MEGSHLQELGMEGSHLQELGMEGSHLQELRMEGSHLQELGMEGSHLQELGMKGSPFQESRREWESPTGVGNGGGVAWRSWGWRVNVLQKSRMEGSLLQGFGDGG